MVGRRFPLLVLLVCAGLSAVGGPVASSDAYHLAIWRLEHDFVKRADLEETGMRKGVLVATEGRSLERFLFRLEALEGEIRSLDSGSAARLQRKIGAVRSRIDSWQGPDIAGGEGVLDFRAVLPSSDCATGQSLSTETVFWATTDFPAAESETHTAWFEASGLPTGWFRIDTFGSTVDTIVTAYDSCEAAVLGANDDDLGLQSRLVVNKSEASQLVVQVQVLAHQGQQSVFLTLSGTGSGGISGIVRNESTDEPISWVRLELYDSLGNYEGSEYTSSSGTYSFSGLEPDTYFVLTDNTDDYLDELWDNIPCETNCEATSGDSIAVDQEMVTGIDFDLSPGASISGTVLEIGGGLVTEGTVRLFGPSGQEIGYQYLDDLGRFQLRALIGGTYYLGTSLYEHLDEVWDDIPCMFECEPLTGTPIELEDMQIATGFDFHVRRLGTISGRLTDAETDLPIANQEVGLEQSPGNDSDYAYSDINGNWSSGGLLPGTYFVATHLYDQYRNEIYDDIPCDRFCDDYEQGTPIALEVEESITAIDIALDPLGAISGVVSDESTTGPIAGVRIEGWVSGGGMAQSGYSSTLGYYELPDLYPGTYYVVTDEFGPFVDELFDNIPCFRGLPTGCDPYAGTPISIDVAILQEDIDFALNRGGILRGRLTDKATGQPLVDSEVRAYLSSGAEAGEERSGSEGYFAIEGLPTGVYFLKAVSGTHMDELWDGFECEGGCDPLGGTSIPLKLGGFVDNLDFDLTLQGGLSGLVTDGEGPVPGVILHAWDNLGEVVAAGVTDIAGFYQIDLSSGFYYLSTDAPDGYVNRLWVDVACPIGPAIDGLCDPLDGDEITVVGADPVQTGFDFDLSDLLFADGFETGDPSAWSEVVN